MDSPRSGLRAVSAPVTMPQGIAPGVLLGGISFFTDNAQKNRKKERDADLPAAGRSGFQGPDKIDG
jgi:hypothetical protein